MKTLKEICESDLNEMFMPIVPVISSTNIIMPILYMIAMYGAMYFSVNSSPADPGDSWLTKIKKQGVIATAIGKLESFVSNIMKKINLRDIQKDIDLIKESPEFKEWISLPKKQQTLKKLKELANSSNVKISDQTISIIWGHVKHNQDVRGLNYD